MLIGKVPSAANKTNEKGKEHLEYRGRWVLQSSNLLTSISNLPSRSQLLKVESLVLSENLTPNAESPGLVIQQKTT